MRTRVSSLLALGLLATACPKSDTTVPDTPPAVEPAPPASEPPPAPEKPAVEPVSPVAAFGAECRVGLNRARKHVEDLLAVDGPRTLDNTLVPLDEAAMEMERSWGIGLLWRSTHPDPAIREEAGTCEQECAAFESELSLNRGVYEAVAALDTSGYDAETKRLVEHVLRDFRRAGVDKDEATRAELEQLDKDIVENVQEFRKALDDDVRSFQVDNAAALDGLPQDWIDAHPPGDDGKITITTRYPDLFPVSQYAKSDEVRKQMYMQSRSRGDQHKDVLRRILALRWKKAQMLGYKDFADYYIEDKMMKSGARAAKFIDRTARLARKRMKRDYKAMLKRRRKDDRKARRLEDWDKMYYETLVKAEDYDLDLRELRQYFWYPDVKQGLLDVTSEMFDIQYVEVKDPRTWHEDVDVYDVMQGGQKIGRIFLDMHPRDGKYGHAASFPLTPGVAGKSLPEGALVTNFPKTLMEPHQVETMFHEFGHLMHHIFKGKRRWMMLGSVERDFVEAPSQILEEWAADYDVLRRFAKHHETGKVIPKELVERMKRANEFGVGNTVRYQLYYAAMVLEFYRVDPSKLDMDGLSKKLMEKYTPYRYVPGTNRYMQLTQMVGYPASYYTYMWSLVLAKDLFSPFDKHGLLNKEWTLRYRDKVLAPGGSKDAADLVADFLGRPFNYQAFERWLTR